MTTLRAFAVLAVALSSTIPLVPASGTTGSGCGAAVVRFQERFDAAGHVFDLDVAHALKDAVDACPATTGAPAESSPNDAEAWGALQKTTADACSFSDDVSSPPVPDTPIVGYAFIGGNDYPIADSGEANASYVPATGILSFQNEGTVWGLKATSAGVGSVDLHGVPIATAQAGAEGGCSVTNDGLCWASADANVFLPSDLLSPGTLPPSPWGVIITLQSRFYVC